MGAQTEVTWERIAAQRPATSGERIPYAADSPQQIGVLRVPAGGGPFPVVAIVHGGCWLAEYDYRHAEPMAVALTARGYATWVLEYRRIGDPGGGWPGTFLDVGRGLDFLRSLGPARNLDLARVVAVGHSAGGHLALWLAARSKLAAASELYRADPLPLAGVVALGAISDLRSYAAGSGDCNAAVPELMGGLPGAIDARYGEANPLELAPLGLPLRFVHGDGDRIVPLEQSRRFVDVERRANAHVALEVVGGGHFDLIAPFAPAWSVVERHVAELLGGRRDAAR